MNFSNQLWGSVAIVVAAISFWFAFRFAKRGHYPYAITLICFGGLVLRFFSGMDFHLYAWDERYHALVAKNLLHHPLVPTLYDQPIFDYDYKNWGSNHIWLHKPPLTLWLIMISLKIFGVNEIAVRLPSIIVSAIGIVLTYYLGKHFFDKRVGLLAAFFYAINGLLIELATGRHPTDHPDIVFVFFIELAIFFSVYYLKNKSYFVLTLIGIATGCAVLTKWLPALIVVGILFLLLIREEPWRRAIGKCAFVMLIAAILAVPWQVYISSAFPRETSWESYFNYRHLIEALDGHDGTVLYYFALMPRQFGELIFIPIIMFFYMLARKRLSSSGIVLAAWFAVPYLFFSLVATKMPGYVMISAPAIFIILAWAFWLMRDKLESISLKKVTVAYLVLLVLLPVRYSLERIKPFQQSDRNPAWAQELRDLQSRIPQPKSVVFNVGHPVEAMFYANVTAYPFIPTEAQIQQSRDKGFSVFILDDPAIPPEIRGDTSITILRRR